MQGSRGVDPGSLPGYWSRLALTGSGAPVLTHPPGLRDVHPAVLAQRLPTVPQLRQRGAWIGGKKPGCYRARVYPEAGLQMWGGGEHLTCPLPRVSSSKPTIWTQEWVCRDELSPEETLQFTNVLANILFGNTLSAIVYRQTKTTFPKC